MKNAAKLFVIVSSALLLTMVAAGSGRVNGNVKVLKANQTQILIWADGGVPIPPPPKGTGFSTTTNRILLADGGVPIPPPPKGTGFSTTTLNPTLRADGGVPIPPPPTGTSSARWSRNPQIV